MLWHIGVSNHCSGSSEKRGISGLALMPKRLRCHPLAHRSHQSLLRIFRDLILWCWGAFNLALNYSETSCFDTSESPIIAPHLQSIPTHAVIHFAWQGYTFSSSAHNNSYIYIWDTPTLTKPGVVFQKMLSLTTRDRSFRPLRTTCKSIHSLNCIY